MNLRPHRPRSRMMTTSLLVLVAAFSASAETTTLNPQPEQAKPVLIVRATTPIDNDGKPTLDLAAVRYSSSNKLLGLPPSLKEAL